MATGPPAYGAVADGDGEKPSAHLVHPLLPPPPPQQPYYAYPAAAYAAPPPPPTLVFVPASPILLRLRRRLRPRRIPCLRAFSTRTLPFLLLLALLAAAAFLLYPSPPVARVDDLRLDRFRVNPPPFPALDLALSLRLRVRNPGFVLPLRYRAVSAAVSYRGHLLGSAHARPGSGELDARGTTFADAEVWVDAGRVVDDVIDLIGDIAAGSLPLEIVTEVVGKVRVFRFDIPVKLTGE
uniref:Late embryogenesis abundant protein LEA-2 subgroup domain-containing protein n=1 Tax=Leersia perrieri TaxID=77586 RepID=A0A0D9WWQ1_9ORYZ